MTVELESGDHEEWLTPRRRRALVGTGIGSVVSVLVGLAALAASPAGRPLRGALGPWTFVYPYPYAIGVVDQTVFLWWMAVQFPAYGLFLGYAGGRRRLALSITLVIFAHMIGIATSSAFLFGFR